MKKVFVFFVFVIYTTQSFSADKSLFDLKSKSLSKTLNGFGCVELRNDVIETTMLSGGYFTIGTANGIDEGPLDDNCGITFGHPYAMTSYPIFSIDGNWFKLDEYFTDLTNIAPGILEDTVFVSAAVSDLFSFKFALICSGNQAEIEFIFQLVNLDSVSHLLGTGLVFDPGLGKWGDGYLALENGFLSNDTLLNTPNFSSLKLMERNAGAKGLGIEFDFSRNIPTQIIAANWADIFNNQEPNFEPSQLRKLFDLLLKMVWEEESFEPNEEKIKKINLKLIPPDFSSSVFLRWDLNTFLTIENNIMFPKNFDTFLEISNKNSAFINEANLKIATPNILVAKENDFNVSLNPNQTIFQKMTLQAKTIYEDRIINVSALIKDNSHILDELHRNIFIPATPVSDTGLVVLIDTLDISTFPKVGLTFEARHKENDYLITNLEQENVFLYENEFRIPEISLRKDTTGGAESADIIFVLDVTGSMSNEIRAVRNNIIEFSDSLSFRGVDFRLGMVTFLDDIENVYDFTGDIQSFQSLVGQQYAHGGGDGPENSLDALSRAAKFDFRPNSKRIIIWITDNSYHENDWATSLNKQTVINSLLTNDITVHCIGAQSAKSGYYDPILIPTGGNYYDINGNFRDILIDITRFKVVGKYIITYQSPNPIQGNNQIKLKIHYAGLGGSQSIQYAVPAALSTKKHLACFPNPFNPEVTLQIDRSDFVKADIHIYNILGQCVKHFPLTNKPLKELIWNARSQNEINVGSGFYIIQLSFLDRQGKFHRESEKVLYLK